MTRAQIARLLANAEARVERLRGEIATAMKERALFAELLALHESHSERTLSPMQAESAHSLGVRIAAGRAGQSESRKAQIVVGLTDKDVAELTGYSRSTVCKWHSGTIKVPDDAQRLLAKRGIPVLAWSKR